MCHVRERIAGNDPRVWFVSSNVKVLCGNDDNKCQLNDKREKEITYCILSMDRLQHNALESLSLSFLCRVLMIDLSNKVKEDFINIDPRQCRCLIEWLAAPLL